METLRKAQKVEVWGDRPYYVVEYIDGKITFKMLSTHSLTEIIETLRQLNRMDENAILIACCYEQYNGGSFNVEVNPDKQYEEIYKYAKNHYKTFVTKAIGENITETRIHMTKEEILMEKLDKVTERIRRTKIILSDENDEAERKYWTEKLNELEKEKEVVLSQLNGK